MSNVALVDPKFVDGEPWDVAAVAGQQTLDSIELALEALEGFAWSARGAWLSQEEYRTGTMPEGKDFERAPLGRTLADHKMRLRTARKELTTALAAASYDPRSY